MRFSRMHLLGASVGIAVVGSFAPQALASPPSGLVASTLVVANFDHTVHINSDRVKFQTKDATDVRVQKIVLAAGGRSGWHHHPGIVLAAVESGAVTFTDGQCHSTTYGPGLPAGAVFAEGGDDPGQASSSGGATLYVTFVAPSTDPPVFRIEDAAPACAS
ncbi:MAG: hypothetical protein ABIM89_03045 [Mycobacteriales bacterium]